MKCCSKCGIWKPKFEFYKRSTATDGLRSWCKLCCNKDNASREHRYKEYRKQYQSSHKKEYYKRSRKHNLHRKYSLTIRQYNEIAIKQKGVCAICNKENINGNKLSVDHDHKTKEIRGLLCSKCNHALGLLGEDIQILRSMIKYLRKFV